MDTRAKIVAPATLAGRAVTAIVGRFDVLTAGLIRELGQIRSEAGDRPLVAVVIPADDAVLSLKARAEMAAALAVIDYVLILEIEDPEGLLSVVQPARTIRREPADARLARGLEAHVRNRHSG